MKYSDGWKYKTEAQERADVPELAKLTLQTGYVDLCDGVLTVESEYPWDGASFILFYWFGTPKKWMVPSLIHDALYQLMRESKLESSYRKTVDGIFYRLLRERGVSWPVAKAAYYCVRVGGNYAMRHGARVKDVV
jgi:hypothetical protein